MSLYTRSSTDDISKATHQVRVAKADVPAEQAEWVSLLAYSAEDVQSIKDGILLAAGVLGQNVHIEIYKAG